MVIDLTDDSQEEQECAVCYETFATGAIYQCCAKFCCLQCFRQMHVEKAKPDCPYCCATVEVIMQLIKIHFICNFGSNYPSPHGTVHISPSEPVSRLKTLMREHASWQKFTTITPSAVMHRVNREIVPLDQTPVFMTKLSHDETVYVLFGV